MENNVNNTMANENNSKAKLNEALKAFLESVSNVANACREYEESKMVFVLTRTRHYEGEHFKGVMVIECHEFEELERYGVTLSKEYWRAKYPNNYGKPTKMVEEMTCGTILKLGKGEYLQRIG